MNRCTNLNFQRKYYKSICYLKNQIGGASLLFPINNRIFTKRSFRLYSFIPFEDKVPMVIKNYSFFIRLYRKVLLIMMSWILYIRSFFIKDKTYLFAVLVLPAISLLFMYLTNIYPTLFSGFSACYFFISLGLQLIIYDLLGSKISYHALDDIDPVISITTLIVLSKRSRKIVRHFSSKALFGIVVGKTNMTATGRATLITGIVTGGAWLYNAHKDRKAADNRANADRSQRDDHFYTTETRLRNEAQKVRDEAQKVRDHERLRWEHESKTKRSFWSRK